jgi:hypothetical protein
MGLLKGESGSGCRLSVVGGTKKYRNKSNVTSTKRTGKGSGGNGRLSEKGKRR